MQLVISSQKKMILVLAQLILSYIDLIIDGLKELQREVVLHPSKESRLTDLIQIIESIYDI